MRRYALIMLLALIAGCCGDAPQQKPPVATKQERGVVDGTPKRLLIGLQDDALLTSAEPRAWSLMQRLGVSVIRYNAAWNNVAPTKPTDPLNPNDPAYNWSAVDELVTKAHAIGAHVLLTLVQAPAWANGNRHPAFGPDDSEDYGRFCHAAARRYSGSFVPVGEGSPLPAISAFTVWNEPNGGEFFRPQDAETPARYARLANACTHAIHEVSPGARVAIGPVASRGSRGGLGPLAFLQAYQAAGGKRPDAVAVNPYMYGLDPVFAPGARLEGSEINLRNLDLLEGWASSTYGSIIPVWVTEFTWRTAETPGRGVVTNEQQLALTKQSVMLVRTSYPYVKMMVWFLLRDQGPTAYWRSGLVTFDWQQKPAFELWTAYAHDTS